MTIVQQLKVELTSIFWTKEYMCLCWTHFVLGSQFVWTKLSGQNRMDMIRTWTCGGRVGDMNIMARLEDTNIPKKPIENINI